MTDDGFLPSLSAWREPHARPAQFLRTAGNWPSETASGEAFDMLCERWLADYFTLYSERAGTLTQPLDSQQRVRMRIDRLLIPKSRLEDAGWEHGGLGVEIKRSDMDIGPALNQTIDYRRSVFTIRGGLKITPSWVFTWPLDKQHGPMASLMAHQRIGSAWTTKWQPLSFYSGEERILSVHHDGEIQIGAGRSGTKSGSR